MTNAGGSATAGSLVNRNFFKNYRIGQTGTNVGVQIDAGGTNVFVDLACEGVNTGTSPIATPTGVYIAASDPVTGGNNDDNHFYGTQNEANTRDCYCDDPYTMFVGFSSTGGAKLAGAFFETNAVGWFTNTAYVKQHMPGPVDFDPAATIPAWAFGTPVSALSVAKYSGTTALTANSATADLSIPNPRHPMLLMISHDGNLGLLGLWILSGDGTTNPTLTNIVDGTGSQFTLAVHDATTLRITNVSSGSVHFTWGVLPFGPAL